MIVTRGFGEVQMIVTRGYGLSRIVVLRAEVLHFASKFTRSMRFTSKRTGVIDGA